MMMYNGILVFSDIDPLDYYQNDFNLIYWPSFPCQGTGKPARKISGVQSNIILATTGHHRHSCLLFGISNRRLLYNSYSSYNSDLPIKGGSPTNLQCYLYVMSVSDLNRLFHKEQLTTLCIYVYNILYIQIQIDIHHK